MRSEAIDDELGDAGLNVSMVSESSEGQESTNLLRCRLASRVYPKVSSTPMAVTKSTSSPEPVAEAELDKS